MLLTKTLVRSYRKCLLDTKSSEIFRLFANILHDAYFFLSANTTFAVFTTFIMNEADVPSKPYPRDIMNWSESDVFGPIFNENDSSGELSKV